MNNTILLILSSLMLGLILVPSQESNLINFLITKQFNFMNLKLFFILILVAVIFAVSVIKFLENDRWKRQ